MTFKPDDVLISDDPIITAFVNTLGSAELEFCAGLITRWHQVEGHADWTPVSRFDIGEFMTKHKDDDPYISRCVRNPFWRPDPYAFARGGYITWPEDSPSATKGELTPKFFEAVEKEHERRRGMGMYLGMKRPVEAT